MNQPFTTRPIERWPGALTRGRQRSRFDTGWTSTVDLLQRELRQLGARRVVLQMAITEGDIRIDGMVRASARPEHPGVILAFESKHGPLQYAVDTFNDWQDNVRAIALALEALRKVDRYGVTKRGEQYTGWKQLGSGQMDHDEAARVLDSYGGVKAALKATHPDHGGDPADFERVQEARRVLGPAAR